MERRVEHLQLKKNCFACLHYHHTRIYDKTNPLNFKGKDHCGLRQSRNIDFGILDANDCYIEHECCLYDPHKIAALDPDFQHLKTHKEMECMFEKKYGNPPV